MLAVTPPPLGRIGENGRLVAAGAERLGYAGAPLARNAGDCVQCSSCPQGCRLDAKRAMHVSYLPRAVAAGATVRSGLEARRLLVEHGRAVGVECVRTAPGAPPSRFRVEARRGVICAGGSFGTPELLLRSGLGGPAVGRNLRLHPSTWVGARFDRPVRGWEGIMQSYGVEEWAGGGVMLEATFTPFAYAAHWLPGVGAEHQERLAGFDRIGSNGVQVRDVSSRGRISLGRNGRLRISYRLRAREARQLAFGMARAAEIWFAAGASEVYPQISGNPILGPADVARLDSAPPRGRDLRLESFHPMGTARIGAEPASTVAGPDGAVRGVRDLYVADASVFPTALGVNPMLTIIAAATRIASRAAARWA
jgi:choline dehydrogenase-like flavoprotein